MKCPFCNSNPLIYDSCLQATVCPHCGTVIDDRPISIYPDSSDNYAVTLKHGSYILSRSRRYVNLRFRYMDIVYSNGRSSSRRRRRYERVLLKICSGLMDMAMCTDAVKLFKTLVDKSDVEFFVTKRIMKLIAVSIYAAAKLHRIPLSISDVEEATGVEDLFSAIYKYSGLLKIKRDYEFELEYAFSRVSSIVVKLLNDPEMSHKILMCAKGVLHRILGGSFINRAVAAVYYALINNNVERAYNKIEAICRELNESKKCNNNAWELVKKYLLKNRGESI